MDQERRDAVVIAPCAVATVQRQPDQRTKLLETAMRHILGAMRAIEELKEVVQK